VAERQQRGPAPSPNSAVATITLFDQSSRRNDNAHNSTTKEEAPSACFLGQYFRGIRTKPVGSTPVSPTGEIRGPGIESHFRPGFCETQIRAAHALPGW
jgi:hypothetical protein